METSERQTKAIESGPAVSVSSADTTVARISTTRQQQATTSGRPQRATPRPSSDRCRNCGRQYPHEGGRTSCPAYNSVCRGCNRLHHWVRCCRSTSGSGASYGASRQPPPPSGRYQATDRQQTVASYPSRGRGGRGRGAGQQLQRVNQIDHAVEVQSDQSDEYVFSLHSQSTSQPRATIDIQGNVVSFVIDTGASVNILDESTYNSFRNPPKLNKAKTNIFTYGANTPVSVIGTFESECESNNRLTVGMFFVTRGNSGSLLSYKTASELGLIKLSVEHTVNTVGHAITIDDLERKYPQLFAGVGKMKNYEAKLYVDPTVKPVAQMNRRVPFHLQPAVEKELKQMIADDIIEPVTGPVQWVSPLVVVNKQNQPGKIRLCLDSRCINASLLRQRATITMNIDEIIHQLNGSTIFSRFDLRSAFTQLV